MNTREALLTRAFELFVAEGYEAVGVQRIVDAVGVGKPTLYHYFGSKLGLLEVLLGEALEPFWVEFEQAAHYDGDLTQTLQHVIDCCLRRAHARPDAYRWFLSLSLAPPDSEPAKLVRPLITRQRAIVQRLFEDASADHGNMRGRSLHYAVALLGTIHAAIEATRVGVLPLDRHTAHETRRFFMHGIFS